LRYWLKPIRPFHQSVRPIRVFLAIVAITAVGAALALMSAHPPAD